jgi:hypothetical protein
MEVVTVATLPPPCRLRPGVTGAEEDPAHDAEHGRDQDFALELGSVEPQKGEPVEAAPDRLVVLGADGRCAA